MEEIVLSLMDDWHFHPRDDDEISEMVLRHLVSSGFMRGIPIFNFKEPLDTARKVEKEGRRLNWICPEFEVVLCAMLTGNSTAQTMKELDSAGVKRIKIIPDLFTTNAVTGINWSNIWEKDLCFREMEKREMDVLVHAEASCLDLAGNPITHPLFRESLGLQEVNKLAKAYRGIRFTIEHVSTAEAVSYILNDAPSNVYGSIATRYLLSTFYEVYDQRGRKVSDRWCMPVYKLLYDREELRMAAMSGSGRFFAISDKAPHKYKDPLDPPAGNYDGLTDICLAAEVFEEYGALGKLRDFYSGFGADRYRLPRNKGQIVLQKESWTPPKEINGVRIYGGGKEMSWRVKEVIH